MAKECYPCDQRVRLALTYATNRELINQTNYETYYTIINQPCSPLSAFYNKNVEEYKYNIDKAGKPLGEAGWKKG